jgi:hypothetical protein
MVLSASDKREIAAMFQSFSEFQRPPMRPEDILLQAALDYATPRVTSGAQAFTERMTTGRQAVSGPEQVLETLLVPTKRKKAMTKFNKAVKAGMKIVRSSSSYGKKGTISNSKKAFAAVTKSVSKARKGAKLPKKGVLRKVQSHAKGILGTAAAMSRKAIKRGPKGRKLRIF